MKYEDYSCDHMVFVLCVVLEVLPDIIEVPSEVGTSPGLALTVDLMAPNQR